MRYISIFIITIYSSTIYSQEYLKDTLLLNDTLSYIVPLKHEPNSLIFSDPNLKNLGFVKVNKLKYDVSFGHPKDLRNYIWSTDFYRETTIKKTVYRQFMHHFKNRYVLFIEGSNVYEVLPFGLSID